MRAIQSIGSNSDSFLFKISFLFGKNCPIDMLSDPKARELNTPTEVQYDYLRIFQKIFENFSDLFLGRPN